MITSIMGTPNPIADIIEPLCVGFTCTINYTHITFGKYFVFLPFI